MTFIRPDLATLIARVRDDADSKLPGTESRLLRSLIDLLLRVHTGAADALYGYLDAIAQECIWDRADGSYLERWAAIWGVQKKSGHAASGLVTLSGLDGAIVPDLAVLLRADGAAFVVSGPVAVSGGAASVTVTASIAGAAGNTLAGTALGFASPAAGVGAAAVVAGGGLLGGADDEADSALLARLLARIQQPPQGGAKSDYIEWALAQAEVTRAWVLPGWMGAGTVGLTFVMDGRTDIFPTGDDVTAMAAAIEPLRPVTADVVVFSPAPVSVPFILSVSPVGARAAVQAELDDLFAREAEPGGTLLISHVREAIKSACDDYDLRSPAGNYVAPAGAMPVRGAITWVD